MSALARRAVASLVFLILVMGALVFGPAGTFAYWQGWAFIAIYFAISVAVTLDLMHRDPALLERRMKGGPFAEKEPTQKIIMAVASVGFIALLVVPALDHRFGWSAMSPAATLAGDALLVLGWLGILAVFRVNTFTASTIEIAPDHKVISTGLYAVVRHPMYATALVMLLGIPIALGSWCGVLVVAALVPVLMWRMVDEERFLVKNLPGYDAYRQKVRWRLVPGVL